MPLRLCVIGNSHIAALKLGWDADTAAGQARRDLFDPTFFGAPRDGMRNVDFADGCLVPTRKDTADYFKLISGGQDRISLADYDAFLLVGLNISSKRILRFYKTHAWAGLTGTAGKVVVHPAFAAEYLAERYADTRMISIATTLRRGTERPIFAVAEPHWASWAKSASEVSNFGWAAAIATGDAPAIGQVFLQAVRQAFAPYGQIVAQPEETVEDSIMTQAAFNKDASRLITGDGGGTDASHMNAAYGQAVWSRLATALPA